MHEAPEVDVLEAAAEERAEPLQTVLLHANVAAVGMAQGAAAPLQLAADVVHERPKGKRVLVYVLKRGTRANACTQVRQQQRAACEQVLRKGCALQNAQLHLARA